MISIPPIAPPRADQPRVPAALAALQRASSVAARVSTPPIVSVAPKIALGTESQGAPVPEDIAQGTQLPIALLAISPRLAEAMKAMTDAGTPDAICDALIAFAAKRWSAVLLLDVERLEATGRRAHGAQMSDDLAQWIVMSLDEPSLLQAAVMTTTVATATRPGHGDVEDRLQKLLGMARAPSAIAIATDGRPGFLLAVGDPAGDDLKTAAADLERLARAAGDAFTRLHGR